MSLKFKLIVVGVVLYFSLFFFPVNMFIQSINNNQNTIKIISDANINHLANTNIWINPNILKVISYDGYTKIEPDHYVSDKAGAKLVVEKISKISAYIEVVVSDSGSNLLICNGISSFNYNCMSDEIKLIQIPLLFKNVMINILINIVAFMIGVFLIYQLGKALFKNDIVIFYRERLSIFIIIVVYSLIIIIAPIYYLASPICYTITATKNINGESISNIWISKEIFEVMSNYGFKEIENDHFVSNEDGAELTLKRKRNKSEAYIYIVTGGNGSSYIIKDAVSELIVNSFDGNEIESIKVDLEFGWEVWNYIRLLLILVTILVVCCIYKYVNNIITRYSIRIGFEVEKFLNSYKQQIIVLFFQLIFVSISFGMLFRQILCDDDFFGLAHYSEKISLKIDIFGRPVASLMGYLFRLIIKDWPSSFNAVPSLMFFMLAAVVSGFMFYFIFQKYFNKNSINRAFLLIFSGLIVCNPLMSDLVRFNGARTYYVWGIPFALLAAKIFLEKQKITLVSIIWLTISIFTYQAQGAYFVIVCCIALNLEYIRSGSKIFEGHKFIELIKKYLYCAVCYIIPCLLNRIWMKMLVDELQHYKIQTWHFDFFKKWDEFCWWISYVVMGKNGRMTVGVFLFFLLVTGIIFLFVWNGTKVINKASVLLITLMTVAIGFLSLFYFQFFMANIWIDARTCTALIGLPAAFVFPSIVILDRGKNVIHNVDKILLVFCVIFTLICIKDIQTNNMKLYATNIADFERTKFYVSQIADYEEKTGYEITEVGFWIDANPTWVYSDFSIGNDRTTFPNRSAYESVWARAEILSVISGKNIYTLLEEIPKSVLKKWEGKDWDSLNNEQVICIGNKAYIALY